jgi:hypothetical protein
MVRLGEQHYIRKLTGDIRSAVVEDLKRSHLAPALFPFTGIALVSQQHQP